MKKGIPHRVFIHPGFLNSLEQAAIERGQEPNQVIRSILFRLNRDEFILVLMPGKCQVDWKMLRNYLGVTRITMATTEEVRRITGYELGAVAPFGLPKPIRILVDESVFTQEEISLGSGTQGIAIIMRTTDFIQALGDVEISRFTNLESTGN